MEPAVPVSDREFVAALRQAVERYFRSVDRWETAYRKYYRVPLRGGKPPDDLVEQQAEYDSARAVLAAMIPRARGLSFRHGLRDPWTGLIRSPLGQSTPQDRYASAISRAERTASIECLLELAEAYAELPHTDGPPPMRSWWRRLLGFFY
ncbi:MAG TPA: hypothetical protein VHW09_07485 [Bryobacteraceae bacterium]|jgi:hypothetical protein|nr:hypothetical protein [Bryobacteraceae bacterium]